VNPRFKYRTDIPYFDIEAVTSDTGRKYYTPDGPAPSVTTILSTLPHPELDAWRVRVGDEEADRISKEATDIGTNMHDRLEAYVKNEEFIDTGVQCEWMAKKMFQQVKVMGLAKLNEVWGVEVALHLYNLYAGRTDLVGVYNRIPSIIDYKTSKFFKRDSWLTNYKLQTAAYAVAHDEMFGDLGIRQGVLLIGTRPNKEYKVTPRVQKIIIPAEEMDHYKYEWMQVVENYHREL